jgi:hypothetical protein
VKGLCEHLFMSVGIVMVLSLVGLLKICHGYDGELDYISNLYL